MKVVYFLRYVKIYDFFSKSTYTLNLYSNVTGFVCSIFLRSYLPYRSLKQSIKGQNLNVIASLFKDEIRCVYYSLFNLPKNTS
jgi:hypothetical protein